MKTLKVSAILIITCLTVISCQETNLGPKNKKSSKITTKQQPIRSNNVNKKLARNVALNFSNSASFSKERNSKTKSKSVGSTNLQGFRESNIKKVLSVVSQKKDTTMYIITFKPKGYVIVSATKKTYPVLGYSKDTKFDINHIPGKLAFWFKSSSIKIHGIKKSDNIIASSKVNHSWSTASAVVRPPKHCLTRTEQEGCIDQPPAPSPPTSKPGPTQHVQRGPLIQVEWDQSAPFNNLVPHKNNSDYDHACPAGKECPAGCVAIAMAQVMHYWEYPTNYNWSAMPLNKYTSYQPGNVSPEAKLLRDVGIKVGMNYDTDGSGAMPSDIKPALIQNFGYNQSSMSYVDHFDKQKVISNINAGACYTIRVC